MTEIVLENIDKISELALFADAYKKGFIKLNISKIARELNKDRKTVKKYLKGDVPVGIRKRNKYLEDRKSVV